MEEVHYRRGRNKKYAQILFEKSSFGRQPALMRSEGGDTIRSHRSALNLEMVRSSLKVFGGISFSAEKGNFLD